MGRGTLTKPVAVAPPSCRLGGVITVTLPFPLATQVHRYITVSSCHPGASLRYRYNITVTLPFPLATQVPRYLPYI